MNDVPLIQSPDTNSINTSIIAIKKQLRTINEALGLIDIPDAPDLSPYVKKSDVVDTVESGNMNPVTSNAVANSNAMPVDEVTVDNMHSVTSNAVYNSINDYFIRTIHRVWGQLQDYGTEDISLPMGNTYLYVNTHVYNIEVILFSFYSNEIGQFSRLLGNTTTISAIGNGKIRLKADSICRGNIFKLGNTSGT